MSGQILDASIVAAPKQRNTDGEKRDIKQGRVPPEWANKPAKLRQKHRDAEETVQAGRDRREAAAAFDSALMASLERMARGLVLRAPHPPHLALLRRGRQARNRYVRPASFLGRNRRGDPMADLLDRVLSIATLRAVIRRRCCAGVSATTAVRQAEVTAQQRMIECTYDRMDYAGRTVRATSSTSPPQPKTSANSPSSLPCHADRSLPDRRSGYRYATAHRVRRRQLLTFSTLGNGRQLLTGGR
jgi:hypothetical protein